VDIEKSAVRGRSGGSSQVVIEEPNAVKREEKRLYALRGPKE
jgi:hypothetical protein